LIKLSKKRRKKLRNKMKIKMSGCGNHKTKVRKKKKSPLKKAMRKN